MNPKIRNWLLGVLGVVVFILGMPLAQHVFAGADTSAVEVETARHASPGALPETASHQVIKLGDRYLRIFPTGDDSVGAQLYDSQFTLIAANESETSLTFTLPDGRKEVLNITVPPAEKCSMDEHSAGGGDCCAGAAEGMEHENCDH